VLELVHHQWSKKMAVLIPKSENWRIYCDDAAEPVLPLAAENTAPILNGATQVVRIRVTIKGTASSGLTTANRIQYSTDDVNFTDMASGNHFNWYDGLGTHGNTVASNLLSDASTKKTYVEAAGAPGANFSLNSMNEFDFCIVPTLNATPGTLYYFRFLYSTTPSPGPYSYTVVGLDTNKTHPRLTTFLWKPKIMVH
jgi:hypothetical protein